MFVRKMGKKDPPNVKVGLTAEEGTRLADSLKQVLDFINVVDPCDEPELDEARYTLDRLRAALEGGMVR